MLSFIRSDLAQLTAYAPHPGGEDGTPVTTVLDRLDTNECPFDLPPELKEKLAWSYQQEIESNRYPDGGHFALKGAIAEYVNEHTSHPVTAEQISVGNGSDELIRSLLIATCLGQEGSILVANPTFSMYGILARTLGIPVVTVGRSESTFEVDLVAAQQAISQTQNPPIRVVFMVHPNSPTANALTEAEIDWLRRLPPEILVVIDEAYFEFSQTTLVGELAQHPNWVILRTFSKAFRLAAHRIGYGVGHPELIAALEKVRLPYNLPSLTQTAARIALAHRSELLAVIPGMLADRDRLYQALATDPNLQLWPSQANFLYLRPKMADPQQREAIMAQWVKLLKTQGTLMRHTGGGIRLTVGTPAENQHSQARLPQTLATLLSQP